MITYHGSEIKFKSFDFNKSTELGVCFASKAWAAHAYGKIIYTVELIPTQILDLTDKVDAQKICQLCPYLTSVLEEDNNAPISEIIEDDFSIFTELVQEAGAMIDDYDKSDISKPENFIRWRMLDAAKKAGYDCVLIEDYTEGGEHETYIALNSKIIKKVN